METAGSLRLPRRAPVILVAGLLAAFLAVGAIGLLRYGTNYWLYRGFDAPRDPAYVKVKGSTLRLDLASPALGGRSQQVYVYLPPGYAQHPNRRYPVLYLLHGTPGRPLAFIETLRMGVVEDELVARGRSHPAILVMPFGSTGTFTDKEWANGFAKNQGWATFVWRDLVRTIDARYRTIPSARGRAIAGLSEGGFGAINIALHHPREFSVVESWSGYQQPDKLRSIFGPKLQLLAANDPMRQVTHEARLLRRLGTTFWFYSGSGDSLHKQNAAFAAELTQLHVRHHYFEVYGGHNWALWRGNAVSAYVAAAARLAHG
jgi:enterochelin esterase-like enzyme